VSEEIFSFDEKFIITKKKLVYDDADRCLTSLRDEAHRFANAYRKKQMSQEIPS
jgi:excinuclease UvrABC nuclease subunit